MTTAKCSSADSVLEIFHSMTLPPEPVNFNFIKKFMNEFMPHGKIGEGLKKYVAMDIPSTPPSLNIDRVLKTLEKSKDDLITTLVFLRFTWNNANLVVNTLIDSIKAYQVEFQFNPCSFLPACDGFKIIGGDLIQDFQIIARGLFENIHVIIYRSCDELLPFYFYLAQLLDNYLFIRIHDLKEENVVSNNLYGEVIKFNCFGYEVQKEMDNYCCPFVITEEADIYSAVDSICKSICQAQVMVSASHIFIEECVYDQTVSILKDKIKIIHHGPRFDKRTELEFIENQRFSKSDFFTPLKLEIFSANEKSPFKFCLNWNPKDVDEAHRLPKALRFIPVLPFRNLSDLKVLLKENCPAVCPASFWSENLAIIKMESEFEFSPLWINNHGLINFTYPPCITNITTRFFRRGCTGCSPELLASFKKAKKGYFAWQKCVFKHLDVLLDNFHASHSKLDGDLVSCRRRCKSLSKSYDDKIQSLIENKIISSSKPLLKCSNNPLGVVMIHYNDSTLQSLDYLHKLIASSLINGNTVVVFAKDNNVLQKIEQITVPKSLPEGVLGFILTPTICSDCSCLFKPNNYDFPIALFRFVDNSKECYFNCWNGFSFTHLCLKNDVCDDELLSLTSCIKLFSLSQ